MATIVHGIRLSVLFLLLKMFSESWANDRQEFENPFEIPFADSLGIIQRTFLLPLRMINGMGDGNGNTYPQEILGDASAPLLNIYGNEQQTKENDQTQFVNSLVTAELPEPVWSPEPVAEEAGELQSYPMPYRISREIMDQDGNIYHQEIMTDKGPESSEEMFQFLSEEDLDRNLHASMESQQRPEPEDPKDTTESELKSYSMPYPFRLQEIYSNDYQQEKSNEILEPSMIHQEQPEDGVYDPIGDYAVQKQEEPIGMEYVYESKPMDREEKHFYRFHEISEPAAKDSREMKNRVNEADKLNDLYSVSIANDTDDQGKLVIVIKITRKTITTMLTRLHKVKEAKTKVKDQSVSEEVPERVVLIQPLPSVVEASVPLNSSADKSSGEYSDEHGPYEYEDENDSAEKDYEDDDGTSSGSTESVVLFPFKLLQRSLGEDGGYEKGQRLFLIGVHNFDVSAEDQ